MMTLINGNCMKNNKQQVVDWLINNDELVRDIIRKTTEQIKDVDREFMDEAKDQQVDEITRNLSDEIGRNLGLTNEDLVGNIDKETLKKFLEVL